MSDSQKSLYQRMSRLSLTKELERGCDYILMDTIDDIEYYTPNDEDWGSIVALSHEHKLATYTGFYEMDDMAAEDSDYKQIVHDGELKCVFEVQS